MTTAVVSPAPAGQSPQGHCRRCGKIWTLNERQGVCRWCGKPATCQTATTKPRHNKSSRRRKQRQDNGNGNGYDQLPEPEHTYYIVALPFANGVPEREDLLHTIIANLIDAGRNNGHKPDNPSWMYRIASFTKADYWRTFYKHTNGLDCGHCSKAQKAKCKDQDLYRDCPKLIKLDSLNEPIMDSEGNLTERGDLIADDNALDLDAWVDSRTFLLGAPERLLVIGEKLRGGIALTQVEHNYLCRWRKREQNKLF